MVTQVLNIAKVFGQKWWIVCSFLLCFGCNDAQKSVPYYMTPDLSPTWDIKELKAGAHAIDTFTFINHHGEEFGSKQLAGKTYLANFFFTSCPAICPKMSNNILKVARHFVETDRVQIVSFSVTPDIDSVSKLKQYHEIYDMGKNWSLLTGNQSDIYKLARHSFYVEEEFGLSLDTDEFLHTERCILIDENGHIRGVYNATVALDMERIIDDIDLLLN
jgi:protein SCO1